MVFTSTTAFNIVGETLGQIGTGSINADCEPINGNTGTPYFIMSSAGFGSGWADGNVIRFNTVGANYPIDIARTVLKSDESVLTDTFRIAIRGDIDR